MVDVVGRVVEVWRYPLKSAQGTRVGRGRLAAGGMPHDRGWALFDPRRPKRPLSAKRVPQLLDLFADVDGDELVVTFPDGTTALEGDVAAAISEWMGDLVELRRAEEGGFFDDADVHVISTASLGAWDGRRFRPTVVVDAGDGYPEDAWVGRAVRLGNAFGRVVQRTVRCTMVTEPQPGGVEHEVSVLTDLGARDDSLGVYIEITGGGWVAEGDGIELFAAGSPYERVELFGPQGGDPVEVVEPDPAWPERFADVRARIVDALGPVAVRVEHVGSTSVPGLPAKPVIDVQVSVDDVADESAYAPKLETLGWPMRARDEGTRFFRDPSGAPRRVHVHVCAAGSRWERIHLLFRDYLRAHPDQAAAYAELKRALASRHRDERVAYTEGKTAFVEATLERAEAWAAATAWSVAQS